MSKVSRVFGQNLGCLIKEKKINESELAERLGYSIQDIKNIMDSRLFIPKVEKEQIAETIGVSLVDLLHEKEWGTTSNPLIECRGYFSSESSQNEILDLFDAYCDIQEMLERERPSK